MKRARASRAPSIAPTRESEGLFGTKEGFVPGASLGLLL